MSQDKPVGSEVIQQPSSAMPSSVEPTVTPKKKSNKLLIAVLIIIPLVLIIFAAIVIAGLAVYKGYQDAANEITEILPTDINVTTTVETSETNAKSFPANKLTPRITPNVKSIPQVSYLEMRGMYYAEYNGRPIVFIYNEEPGNPGWIFESINYIKSSPFELTEHLFLSDEEYLEFPSSLENIVKLATINYDIDDDLTDSIFPNSPISIVEATTNEDDETLYISYITEIYNYSQEKKARGILTYDYDHNFSNCTFNSFVQNYDNEIASDFNGAYFFKSIAGDYVVASLTNCFACESSDEATIVINFATKKYIRVGNIVEDAYFDLDDNTVTLTHMIYAGQESEDCVADCPVYDYGDKETFMLP